MEDNLPKEADLNAGIRKRRPVGLRDVRVESYVDNVRRNIAGFKIFIDVQDTDWVVVDHEGVIDGSLKLRCDWEVGLGSIKGDSHEEMMDHISRLMYAQILMDFGDLIMAPVVSDSPDPLWATTNKKKFIRREDAREFIRMNPKFMADRIAEGSSFRDEDWYRQFELDQKKEINNPGLD